MGDQSERSSKTPSNPTRSGNPQDPAKGPRKDPDPKAGMDREVGDLDDPDGVEDDGALPGRMGGGLAGG